MALTIHPRTGQILMCDFREGCFKPPEMVKKRPVIVLATRPGKLVIVVALSTVEPDPVEACNMALPKACMPQLGFFQQKDSWVKGDMVYSVGFHRLSLITLGKRDAQGKRQYFTRRLSREGMRGIYACVLNGLGVGHVARHI